MDVNLYNTASAFNNSCRSILLIEEAKNNLFVGCIDTVDSVYRYEKFIFGEVVNQSQIELLFVCNQKGQILLFSPSLTADKRVYELLSNEIHKIGLQINGVKADPLVADMFAKEYSRRASRNIEVNMHMSILLLTRLNPTKLLDLEVRKITASSEYTLTPTHIQFINESIYGQEGLYFLIKENTPVSQAAIRRKVSMDGVFTPEEHRRNGYSTTLVYSLAKRILDDGNSYCVVHTDADDPISNQLYRNIGFEYIADMKDIVFR